MSVIFELDGSVSLKGEADPSRTLRIPASASQAKRERDIAAFVAAEPRPVPAVVTNYQARQALINAGRFDEADTAVRASGNPSALAAWNHAGTFYRASPFIGLIGSVLGMSEQEIDALFQAAELVQ